MAKVRGLVLAGALGALFFCAVPASAQAGPGQAQVQVQVQQAQKHQLRVTIDQTPAAAKALVPAPQQAAPGPVLDPTQTDKANAQKTRSKLIAGGVAVVLLAIVFFGRRARSKKSKG
ncbi:hypothetical protein VSH64_42170 [Amycolatopsis rhabdoformis]|uniref:LPXTG cell wall anchor domain-containing protein n=1 Tax=Amycolatopsis rhabdoformis TaxID=1448059 RepID=A0ABZ1I751_9PSEU|nr:hypothetical protein [Amycolatopsis rhabdoformis]WSE29344.1 hypothetical protein VSH64_42170 [Amycolatopsis rhabdoformis]